jgi:hypothetical protein
MLATLFEKTTLTSYFYAGIVLVLVSFLRYTNQHDLVFNASAIGIQLLETGLVFVTLLLSSLYFRASGFLKLDNFYALLFVLFYGFIPEVSGALLNWIQLDLLLWVAVLFLRIPWKQNPQRILLDLSLIFGVSVFLSFPNSSYLLLIYIGLWMTEVKKTQLFLIPIVTLLFFSVIPLTLSDLFFSRDFLFSKVTFNFVPDLIQRGTVKEIIWLSLGGFSLLVLIRELALRGRLNKPQKNSINLQLGFLFLVVIQSIFLEGQTSKSLFLLPIIVFAFKRIWVPKTQRGRLHLLSAILVSALLVQSLFPL